MRKGLPTILAPLAVRVVCTTLSLSHRKETLASPAGASKPVTWSDTCRWCELDKNVEMRYTDIAV
jgi:hypothetical protein